MDSRNKFYKAAFYHRGYGFNSQVFRETSPYKYSQGLGDVLRGIMRFIRRVAQFFKQVAMKGVQSLFKAGNKAIKEGAKVKDVIKSTLEPTVGAVLGATVDQVASKLIEKRDNQNDATPPNPPMGVPEFVRAGSGHKRRSRSVYVGQSLYFAIHKQEY